MPVGLSAAAGARRPQRFRVVYSSHATEGVRMVLFLFSHTSSSNFREGKKVGHDAHSPSRARKVAVPNNGGPPT